MRADRQRNTAAGRPTTTISGLVRTTVGAPLAGVCVTAYGPSGAKSAVTNARGRYFITGLRGGRYQLKYRRCTGSPGQYLQEWYGNALQRAASKTVVLTNSSLQLVQPLAPVTLYQTSARFPFGAAVGHPTSPAAVLRSMLAAGRRAGLGTKVTTTSRKGQISGVVTGSSGQRLGGICVDVASFSGPYGALVPTSSSGRYRTPRLPAGKYAMLFYPGCGNHGNWLVQIYKGIYNPNKAPTPVRIRSSHTTTINAVMQPGAEISGTVTGPHGQKLSGICVEPLQTRGTDYLYFSAVAHDGAYHVRGLPAGSYEMGFAPCRTTSPYAPTLWPDTQNYGSAPRISVRPPQSVRHIDEVMQTGGVIAGTVTSQTTPATPLPGMCVFVSEDNGLFEFGSAATNSAGHYSIKGLPSGPYTVTAIPGCDNNANYVERNYPSRVAVNLGATDSGIDISLPVGNIISGTVTSAATSSPVSGICVEISLSNGEPIAETNTAADGTYSVNQLDHGTYEVQFAGGCGSTGSYAPQAYNNTFILTPDNIPIPGAGQTVTGIDAALQPGPVISGIVRDTAGHRLSGICAFAITQAGVEYGFAVTVNGSYQMPNLAPGQYQVVFQPGCGNEADLATVWYRSQINEANAGTISASSGTVRGINAALPPAGGMSGVVRNAKGKDLPFSCIIVTGLTGDAKGQSGEIVLFGGGQYEVDGMPLGKWQVAFAPSCVELNYATQYYKDRPSPAGATDIRITAFHLDKGISSAVVRGASISGRLTTGGKPDTQMCVYAQNVAVADDFGGGFTDSNGDYRVVGLNTGRYELEAYPCGTADENIATVLLPQIVHVTQPKNKGHVNAAIPVAGAMTGQVLGGSPAAGEAGVCVEAIQTNGIGFGEASTSLSGKFTMKGLTPGFYQVLVGDPACSFGNPDLAAVWYPDAASQSQAQLVDVTSGATTALTSSVTLSPGGSLSGTVSQKGGAALRGACVAATATGAFQLPVYAVTSGTGSYSIIDLQPGTYRVQFSSGCGANGYQSQWWNDKPNRKTATLVTVTAGTTTTGINAALAK